MKWYASFFLITSYKSQKKTEVTNRNISSFPNDTMKTFLPFITFVSSHFQGNLLKTTLANKLWNKSNVPYNTGRPS